MNRTSKWVTASFLALALAGSTTAWSADPPDSGAKKEVEKAKPEEVKPAPAPAITHHRIVIDGKTIPYTATAATIDLKNGKDEPIGRMFYVAYTQDGVSDATRRPVTFCYNGGPGSSTLWLEMGSFGPVRVDASDAEPTPPPPYRIESNPESLLDVTDLVFIDAMGTGYSRIIGKGTPKDFYGTDPDIAAFGQFIERWVSTNRRWNSPKFLLGESYGTTRSSGLLAWLQNKGMAFNGAVMISSYLNAYDDFNGPPFSNDLPYEFYLPTMAATAWYHDRLDPKPADLAAFVQEVRQFALGEYAAALAKGSRLGEKERDAVVAKLHRYTAMPEDFLRQANIRIDPSRFEKELLRGERRTVGRLDSRFTGIDHDAAGERPEDDAADSAFGAAFVAAWNTYSRGDLNYQSDDLYKPTNYPEVGKEWDDRHGQGFRKAPMPDVAEDLRQAMSANPGLKVFFANGYFDFATPFFETEYTVSHMGLDPALEKNLSWGYYPSGHMIYIHPPARKQLKQDLAAFYAAAMH
ncbi:MAG: peptidase S10 [Thermoanaerobaculia bacterium]